MLPDASFSMTPCSYDVVRRLHASLGCSETLAWVLARRGITDPEAARALLVDDDAAGIFHDPFLLGDMTAAVERVRFAIANGEQIAVHGDYDCDGVCSTTLLTEALEALGGQVRPFLPDRFANGYGLQLDTVERFALDGIRLILTVDCGITAVEPIAQAVDHGIDVIVCDHHQPGEQLPAAIICSTRPSDYPFPDLCATAVAGKLAQALGAPYGDAQHELEAIATIADCVPLVGENRQLVRRGLQALRRTERRGLRSLLSTCDLHAREVTEEDVAYRLAPRINAVGRLTQSERAYELLRAADEVTAQRVAAVLHDTNAERRRIEESIVAEALEQIAQWTPAEREARAYVVSGAAWHEGVVGIVASRLVERFHRPVVVIGEQHPLSRGSGRSIDGFDLHAGLAACADLLVRWGGHSAAAGVTIEPDRIREFRERLAAHAQQVLSPEDLEPVERVDAVVAGDELSIGLVEELAQLAPFGQGNPKPRLLAVGARVSEMRGVGAGDRHLRCKITTGGVTAQAIGFGQGDNLAALRDGDRVDACVRVSVNRYRGAESLQLELDRLIAIPTGPPQVLGMCATSCNFDCFERVPLADVLAASDRASAVASAAPDRPVRLEPLLARRDTVDLRHANRALAHVARLATGGASQLLVCADVSRRRDLLSGPLHPQRLGVGAAALASDRCNRLGIDARLRRLAGAGGPRMVLADYGALGQVLSGPVDFDAVVVLDPPVTDQQRELLGSARAPLHLLFGAGDTRFAYTVAEAVANVRATLGDAWKVLRQGPLDPEQLERVLFGEHQRHLHSPAAVAHGIHTLVTRGILERVPDGVVIADYQLQETTHADSHTGLVS